MPTHTPGPWKVYGPRPGFVDIQVESTVPEKWTATKKHSAFNQGICGLDAFVVRARPEEALANARLIAAAPELLEALEATRAELYRLAMKGFFTTHSISVVSGTSTGSLIGTLVARKQFADLKNVYAGGVRTSNVLSIAAGTGTLQLLKTVSDVLGIDVADSQDELIEHNVDILALAAMIDHKTSIYTIQPLKELIRRIITADGFQEIVDNDDVDLIYNIVSMNSGDVKTYSSKNSTATEMERALWASVSQPVFMPMVDIGPEFYADGGLTEINPVQAVFNSSNAYDGILALSCSPDPSKIGYTEPLTDLKDVLLRTLDIFMDDVLLNDVRVPQLFLALRKTLDELKAADQQRHNTLIASFSQELNDLLASVNFSKLKSVPIIVINPDVPVMENGLVFETEVMKAVFAKGEQKADDMLPALTAKFA